MALFLARVYEKPPTGWRIPRAIDTLDRYFSDSVSWSSAVDNGLFVCSWMATSSMYSCQRKSSYFECRDCSDFHFSLLLFFLSTTVVFNLFSATRNQWLSHESTLVPSVENNKPSFATVWMHLDQRNKKKQMTLYCPWFCPWFCPLVQYRHLILNILLLHRLSPSPPWKVSDKETKEKKNKDAD